MVNTIDALDKFVRGDTILRFVSRMDTYVLHDRDAIECRQACVYRPVVDGDGHFVLSRRRQVDLLDQVSDVAEHMENRGISSSADTLLCDTLGRDNEDIKRAYHSSLNEPRLMPGWSIPPEQATITASSQSRSR